MSTPLIVTGRSSPKQLVQIYQENLTYDVPPDLNMAQRFVAACRAILALPTRSGREAESIEFDRSLIADQLERAVAWYQQYGRDTTPPRQFIPVTNWRDLL